MLLNLWGFDSDPWAQHHHLQRELGQLLDWSKGAFSTESELNISMWGNNDEIEVVADVPGVRSEDLDLTVSGRVLTIRCVRNQPEIEEGSRRLVGGIGYGTFEKSVTLPYAAEPERVTAELKRGLLRVRIPRALADKPTKIAVQS